MLQTFLLRIYIFDYNVVRMPKSYFFLLFLSLFVTYGSVWQ